MADYILTETCSYEDSASLAENNFLAFYGQDWWRIMWGTRTPASVQAMMADRLPWNLQSDRHVRRHQKVVHRPSGRVVGYARWILPEKLAGAWTVAQSPPPASEAELIAYEQRFKQADFSHPVSTDALDSAVDALQDRHRPRRDFIKLDYVAVHPEHHRRGIAKMLVQSGIDEAQRLRTPIYVLSTCKESIGLYLNQGFELLESVSQSLTPWGLQSAFDTAALLFSPK